MAANFRAPFTTLGAEFEAAQGVEIASAFGASGLLATQIRQGAPFDVFLSADMKRPQALVDEGVAEGPVRRYAQGRVALWTPNRTAGPEALLAGRIGLPNPKLAPYGQAAVECLQHFNLWEAAEARLVFGNNVAQVVHFLATQALPAGFVALGQLRTMATPAHQYWICPASAHRPINQGAVLLRRSTHQTAAALLDFLTGPRAQARLAQLGYAADG